MYKSIIATLFLILLGSSVLAQDEKALKLSDRTKWKLTERDFQGVLYEGKPAYILGARYQDGNNDEGVVFVYYKPISEEQYGALNSLTGLEEGKRVDLMLRGIPLFVGYFRERSEDIYLYEQSSKWFEIYRLWKPKLRFIEKFINHSVSENNEDSWSSLERFIEQRYKIKFSGVN